MYIYGYCVATLSLARLQIGAYLTHCQYLGLEIATIATTRRMTSWIASPTSLHRLSPLTSKVRDLSISTTETDVTAMD